MAPSGFEVASARPLFTLLFSWDPQNFVEFDDVAVRIPDEADLAPAMPKYARPFGNLDVLCVEPGNERVEIIDDESGMGVTGPFLRNVHQYVAARRLDSVVDEIDARAGFIDETDRTAARRILFGIEYEAEP